MAMLRGMGWKADEGIGGFKKQVIKTIDPVVRPKGLGLGATKPKDNKVLFFQNSITPNFQWLKKRKFLIAHFVCHSPTHIALNISV